MARGWSIRDTDDKYVCDKCFGDDGLKAYARDNAVSNDCSYCGRTSSEPIAAPVDEVAEHIQESHKLEYEHANESMSYDGREGGFQGAPHCDTYDLLEREVELTEDSGELFQDLVFLVEDETWCRRDLTP